jgi:hypothetical protein
MELNISEFEYSDDVEDVGHFDDNTFTPYVKPILKPILKTQPRSPAPNKKQVTYDDILSSLNMTVVDGKLQIVRNNVLEKGKANINEKPNASNVNSKINSKANINYNQIHQKFQEHSQPRNQNSSTNVSRIQSLQTPYERQQQQYQLEQEVPEPLTREQYKKMVLIQYLNNEAQKRRINEMKSKKMMFSTISNNNINISAQRGNSADLNRLFRFAS